MNRLAEFRKCSIIVDVVDHHCASRTQRHPSLVHFKQHVVSAVLAVVNEQVDGRDAAQQPGQPWRLSQKSATTGQASRRDRCADLAVYIRGPSRRQVDTPEMTAAVQGFEDDPAGYAVRDAGFDDLGGAEPPDYAPDRLQERRVAVIPEEVALRPGANTLGGQGRLDRAAQPSVRSRSSLDTPSRCRQFSSQLYLHDV